MKMIEEFYREQSSNPMTSGFDRGWNACIDYLHSQGLLNLWQPIETAPRDGTEILTISASGRIGNAVWYNNPLGYNDTVLNKTTGKWWTVTHWMPLPKPPKEGE